MIWKLIAYIVSRPKIAEWIIYRAIKTPFTHISGPEGLYMGRWWLFNPYPKVRTRWQFPISIRVHWICRADADCHLHDHPWNARTIIMKGGYKEERMFANYTRKAGDTARLNFGEYHRISEIEYGGAWTMFITGKYRGTWGFWVDGEKIPHDQYLGEGQ